MSELIGQGCRKNLGAQEFPNKRGCTACLDEACRECGGLPSLARCQRKHQKRAGGSASSTGHAQTVRGGWEYSGGIGLINFYSFLSSTFALPNLANLLVHSTIRYQFMEQLAECLPPLSTPFCNSPSRCKTAAKRLGCC